MFQTKDVHKQFAHYFQNDELNPYFYLLSKALSEGHICVDFDSIDVEELKNEGFQKIIPIEKIKHSELISDGSTITPLIYWNNKLYFQRYFQYESKIFEKIKTWVVEDKLSKEFTNERFFDLKNQVEELFPNRNPGKVDWQMVAALVAVRNRFSIITGGPGTGKTTTVAKVLALLFELNPNLKVALAAPTGKAAARMAESLKNSTAVDEKTKLNLEKLEPSTIHRLLGFQKNSIYFKHNAQNPIPFDLVIVDESSMIDVALFSKLLDAVSINSKIILLGDKNQLASVEAGSLFGDLCRSQQKLNCFDPETVKFIHSFISDDSSKIPSENIQTSEHLLFEHIVELQYSHRFSDDEGIGKLSQSIIQNNVEKIKEFFENQDNRVCVDQDCSEEIFKDFVKGFEDFIKEKDLKSAFEKFNQLRILCATREGETGVYYLNEKVQKYLQSKSLIRLDALFYENRPVMVNSNNYELGLFNGDIGIVRPDENGELKVWFENSDGSFKSVLPAFLDSVETVFAMTIHKSQGSEFDRVMVVLPKSTDLQLLNRELLYTAVTRAKQKVIIQGSEQGILDCSQRQVKRGSGIMERFNQ